MKSPIIELICATMNLPQKDFVIQVYGHHTWMLFCERTYYTLLYTNLTSDFRLTEVQQQRLQYLSENSSTEPSAELYLQQLRLQVQVKSKHILRYYLTHCACEKATAMSGVSAMEDYVQGVQTLSATYRLWYLDL